MSQNLTILRKGKKMRHVRQLLTFSQTQYFFCSLKRLPLQDQELFYIMTLMRTDTCLDSITKFSINTPSPNGFRSPEVCEGHSQALPFPMFSRLAGTHLHSKQETQVQLESTGFGFPRHVLSDMSLELGIAFVGWDRAIPSN